MASANLIADPVGRNALGECGTLDMKLFTLSTDKSILTLDHTKDLLLPLISLLSGSESPDPSLD